jgi:hypothetical protein
MSAPESAYYFPLAKNVLSSGTSSLKDSSFYHHFNLLLVAPYLMYVGWFSITDKSNMPLHKNFYRILYIAGFIQLVMSLYSVYKIHQNIFLVAILACCVAIIFLMFYAMGNRPACVPSDVPTTFTAEQTATNDKIRAATKLTEGETATMNALVSETTNVLDMAGNFLPSDAGDYLRNLIQVSKRMISNSLVYSDLKQIDAILGGLTEQAKQYKTYGVNTTNLTASSAIFQRIRAIIAPIVATQPTDVESEDTEDADASEDDTDMEMDETPSVSTPKQPSVASKK